MLETEIVAPSKKPDDSIFSLLTHAEDLLKAHSIPVTQAPVTQAPDTRTYE